MDNNMMLIYVIILCIIIICVEIAILLKSNQSKIENSELANKLALLEETKPGVTFNSTFDFKEQCYKLGGVLDANLSNNDDAKYEGALLECTKPSEYTDKPYKEIMSEIDKILKQINRGEFILNNEEDRLRTYFRLVYPKNTKTYSYNELKSLWNSLELYYNLPPEIMPKTPIVSKRDVDKRFFQAPPGINMQQIQNRPPETGPYIEVFHNGAMNAFLRPYKRFNSTFYYPVKGSGIWIPTGNTLIAYNKVHALKLLDMPNKDLLKHAGYDFITFLKEDSRDKDDIEEIEVVDKHSGVNPETGDYMKTRKVKYSISALNNMINEMVKGKNIRKGTKEGKIIDVYYGISDTGDTTLAQIARNRGYDTIQLLQEPQLGGSSGIVNIGSELMHLYEPITSQNFWLRLDPSKVYNYDYPISNLGRYLDKKYL